MLISIRPSLLLVATLAVVAVVPIWQAAADITRQIDATSNTSPSHININDETHHDDTPSWSSGGIRGLRKKKKKKNSMSRSKSHKSAKRPKAKGKKKNVFGKKDTDAKEKDNNNSNNNNNGEDSNNNNNNGEDTGTVVGDDEEEVIITCNGCTTCIDAILGATATATNDEGESESYTCRERIQFLMTSKGGSMSENNACTQVGGEFPTICGSCTPCCTQAQRQVCIDLDAEDGRVCTSSVCTLEVEEGKFNCDTLEKDEEGKLLPPGKYEYSCPTKNPVNPYGTCVDGVCSGNCSEEDVASCDQDVSSCTTKACTKKDGFLRTCGDAVSKADGITCQTNDQFNPEGTCFNGVCSGNCSEEDVAACELDPCSTNICIVKDGNPSCEPEADGTTCKTNNPCKEEGTCSDGVCSGGSDLQPGTKDKCGTSQYIDIPVQCCNGGCCPKDKPLCCKKYLFFGEYEW